MNLYLVRNGDGEAVWLAYEDDEMRIWTYVQNTSKFHLNQGLYRDFYFDHTNTYEPVTAEKALQIIRDGVGRLDERVVGHLVKRFKEDPAALSALEVLATTPVPSARQRTEALTRALKKASKGQWVTWNTYGKAQSDAAYVAASSLRRGKIKIVVKEVGDVDAKVENVDEKLAVRVSRKV